jgi:hypothetical protein
VDKQRDIVPISLKISFPNESDISGIECFKSKNLSLEVQRIFANKSELEIPTLEDINNTLKDVIEIVELVKKVKL